MTPKQPQTSSDGTHSHRRRPSWRSAVVIALSSAVITSVGCDTSLAPVRLPVRAIAPAGIAPPTKMNAPALMTARQQVLAALASYTTALGQAEDSRSGAVARTLLRPHLAASRIDGLVQAMTAIWDRHETFGGQDIRHVSSVIVVGRHAFVHDCDNTSGMSLVDIATGQIVPGSAGTPRANLVTCLDLVAGNWLVQFQLAEDVPCVP